jgi:hypothetical protein
MRKFEREVIYPTGHVKDPGEGMSEGLRKSFPQGYDRLGRYRERPLRVPWGSLCVVGVVVWYLLAVVF